jgi:hypothetical protein
LILTTIVFNVFKVMAAFPGNFNPFRQAFFTQIVGRDDFTDKENFVFTAAICFASTIMSIIFPDVKAVISIIGGVLAV